MAEGDHGVAAIIEAAALRSHSSAESIPYAVERNMRPLERVIRTELGQKDYTDKLRDARGS